MPDRISLQTDPKSNFLEAFRTSFTQETFLKLTLTGHRIPTEKLNTLLIRSVQIKGQSQLAFTYRYATQDHVKNLPIETAIETLQGLLGQSFKHARLFTTNQDFELNYNKRLEPRFTPLKPALKAESNATTTGNDRTKKRLIDLNSHYLYALGITNVQGELIKGRESKFKQMNKFIEILDGLYRSSLLQIQSDLSILDMGCGKGYLTFATYVYFQQVLQKNVTVTGIEYRPDLVDLCNSIAQKSEFNQLKFEPGTIESCPERPTDITIALHACDTATDDAIAKGIQCGSSLIILSPCCHKQIRRAMAKNLVTQSQLEFGILIERQAEIITDRLRALLLERAGYDTKVFEFITAEHTSKNLMITAVKHTRAIDTAKINAKIDALKTQYGIDRHYLETKSFGI